MSTTPKWDADNLQRHHRARLARDPGCFEHLIGILPHVMTESQYEDRSCQAYETAWGEYEGEHRDIQGRVYVESRACFVDADLIVAITDTSRSVFVTCFHEHFSRPHGREPGPGASIGRKRLRYIQKLDIDEKTGLIKNLRRIRGV